MPLGINTSSHRLINTDSIFSTAIMAGKRDPVSFGSEFWTVPQIAYQCTIMENSSAPFSLGGDNLERYFDRRICPFFN